jgi:hypothetical protein
MVEWKDSHGSRGNDMAPRQFSQWVIAIFFACVAFLLILNFTIEIVTRDFRVLRQETGLVLAGHLNISAMVAALI